MQLAIGTKKVLFREMTGLEFFHYMDAEEGVKTRHDGDGYLVEYLDGGPSNHKDHEHYISWSPKDVWEAAYQDVSKGMSFGHALVLLESGDKATRLYDDFGYIIQLSKNAGGGLVYNIVNREGSGFIEWLPSHADLNAKDWVVVE